MTKYIFVTGGVVSGLGKGVTAAAVGRLLRSRGITVAGQKLDPYLNVDPGTMSPYQHGEVFVTNDGDGVPVQSPFGRPHRIWCPLANGRDTDPDAWCHPCQRYPVDPPSDRSRGKRWSD